MNPRAFYSLQPPLAIAVGLTDIAAVGLAGGVGDAVVDALLHDFGHQRMKAEWGGDEKWDLRMAADGGGDELGDVFVPVAARREKVGEDD